LSHFARKATGWQSIPYGQSGELNAAAGKVAVGRDKKGVDPLLCEAGKYCINFS
jgi:hypothetical protein